MKHNSVGFRQGMARLLFITLSAGVMQSCGSRNSSAPTSSTQDPRPNILFIMADDLGYGDLQNMAEAGIPTPGIDSLRRDGVFYSRNYVDATCQPARAGYLTGLDPSASGYAASTISLPSDIDTIPERLVAAGYSTIHVGKWHLGWLIDAAHPLNHGFEHFHGFLFQGLLKGPHRDGQLTNTTPTYLNPWLSTNFGSPQPYEGHLTSLLGTYATDQIRQQAGGDRPWYMNVWLYAPHAPLEPDPALVRSDTEQEQYLALIKGLDNQIVAMRDALAETGQHNTLIVFSSDNGGTNQQLDNNRPLSGKKLGFLEGSLRTPMFVVYPGLPGGVSEDRPVTNLDLSKTIALEAGLDVGDAFTGIDLSPRRFATLQRAAAKFWEAQYDIFSEAYFYGYLSPDGRWRYGRDPALGEALYDLQADPLAQTNLVQDPEQADRLRQIETAYRRWHDGHRVIASGQPAEPFSAIRERGVQRTPGFGSVSWAFALDTRNPPAQPTLIARQQDVASVNLNGRELNISLYDRQLNATLGNGPCQLVTLTTQTKYPEIFRTEHEFLAKLYLNDELVDSLSSTRAYAVDQQNNPLQIHSGNGLTTGYLIWGEFLRAEDSALVPGVQRVSAALACPPPPAAVAF